MKIPLNLEGVLSMVSLLEELGQVFIATPGPGKSPRLGAEGGGHNGPRTLVTVVVCTVMEHSKTKKWETIY